MRTGFQAYPVKFYPVYKDYIWGGRHLERFSRVLPAGIVAESWELSTHPDGVSVIANGTYQGMRFPDYLKAFRDAALGRNQLGDAEDFPLLIKWIDAHQRLSVQVHPNDDYARTREHGQRGKNEMWYILAAEPGAQIIYDVKPGIDRESFAKAVAEGRIERCLQSIEVFPGDVIEIPAGVVHGLGAGILLAEIQQSSNLTYRIYDYNRVDAEGKTRPLHIAKALEVIDFDSTKRVPVKRNIPEEVMVDGVRRSILVANPYFVVERHRINSELTDEDRKERMAIWMVVEGAGRLISGGDELPLHAGDTIFIPAAMGTYRLRGMMTMLKIGLPE
jgi:mannose-6-phosphate isomerase